MVHFKKIHDLECPKPVSLFPRYDSQFGIGGAVNKLIEEDNDLLSDRIIMVVIEKCLALIKLATDGVHKGFTWDSVFTFDA